MTLRELISALGPIANFPGALDAQIKGITVGGRELGPLESADLRRGNVCFVYGRANGDRILTPEFRVIDKWNAPIDDDLDDEIPL